MMRFPTPHYARANHIEKLRHHSKMKNRTVNASSWSKLFLCI